MIPSVPANKLFKELSTPDVPMRLFEPSSFSCNCASPMKDARVANKVDAVDLFSPVAGRTVFEELSLLDRDWMSNPGAPSD